MIQIIISFIYLVGFCLFLSLSDTKNASVIRSKILIIKIPDSSADVVSLPKCV